MNPSKVRRDHLNELTDLPNVGPRVAWALFRIGIDHRSELVGRDPFEMFAVTKNQMRPETKERAGIFHSRAVTAVR